VAYFFHDFSITHWIGMFDLAAFLLRGIEGTPNNSYTEHGMTTNNVAEWEPSQLFSQVLSPLSPFVVGRKTLVYKTVNIKSFCIAENQIYTSVQLIGHVTEMLFKFKKLHKEEN